MKRYIKIYLLLLRLNFSILLVYRINFINSLIGTVGWSLVSLFSMFLLTMRTTSIYGWTPDELLTTAGVYIIIIGIFHAIFSRNFERFSRIINLGQMDSLLLKPVDSQFLLSLWFFNYASLFRIIIGIVFTLAMLQKMRIPLTFINVGGFLIFSVAGILLLYGIWFCIITITIWLTTLSNLVDFMYSFNYFGRFPPEMILQSKNILLYFLLPMTLIATIPSKILLQQFSGMFMILLLFFAVLFFFISRKFWKFALRFYTSAGG